MSGLLRASHSKTFAKLLLLGLVSISATTLSAVAQSVTISLPGEVESVTTGRTPQPDVEVGDQLTFEVTYEVEDGTPVPSANNTFQRYEFSSDRSVFTVRTQARVISIPLEAIDVVNNTGGVSQQIDALFVTASETTAAGFRRIACTITQTAPSAEMLSNRNLPVSSSTLRLDLANVNASCDFTEPNENQLAVRSNAIVNVDGVSIRSGQSVSVYYVNGILTNRDQAFTDWLVVRSALAEAYGGNIPESVTVDFVHNPTAPLGIDFLESTNQLLSQAGITLSALGFSDRVTGLAPASDAIFAAISTAFTILAQADASDELADLHVAEFRRLALNNDGRLVIVAYSQGNFFANAYVERLTSSERSRTRIISIATPSSLSPQNGDYVTDRWDKILSVPFAPPFNLANVSSREEAITYDLNAHSLRLYYLRPGLPGRSRIANLIKNAVEDLRN